MNDVILYEELSMNAHPAINTNVYDGWILRFANGYTNRANSVNSLYSSSIALDEKLSFCENIYNSQKLPTVFKITPLSFQYLDEILDARGYEKVTPTNIMIKNLTTQDTKNLNAVVTDKIYSKWQESYFALNGITDETTIKTAKIFQSKILNKTLCAEVLENDVTAACGMCVIERGYAGLFDIIVGSEYRQKGFGFDICASLLNNALKLGAKHAYLQVVADNAPAIALYTKLGFKYCYQYWYRVKKD